MGVSRVNGMESVNAGQMAMAQAADSVSKSIQNQITSLQREMQEISSKEDISVDVKMKKRQELQQEISSLNTQLRQHEAEVRKEQQAKAATANNSTESSTAETGRSGSKERTGRSGSAERTDRTDNAEKTGRGGSAERNSRTDSTAETGKTGGMKAVVSEVSSMEQARRQGSVVSRIEGGIGVLKAEIKQDTERGASVERKEQELVGLEEKARDASAARFSVLGEARQTMKDAAEREQGGKTGNSVSAATGNSIGNTLFSTTNLSKQVSRTEAQKMNFTLDIYG